MSLSFIFFIFVISGEHDQTQPRHR
jgi:hypothetical protein